MNLNKPVRMLGGAVVGVQLQSRARAAVPSQFQAQGDLVLLAAVALYLMWSGRPSDGAMGDVLDGMAIGIGSVTASNVLPLPF